MKAILVMYIVSLPIPSVVSNASVRMKIDEGNSHIEVENLNIYMNSLFDNCDNHR